MWEKLYENAVGLQHTHADHKVVHGNLKCDNILVTGIKENKTKNIVAVDGLAKFADFGLSYNFSKGVDPNPDEVGAIQWRRQK